MAIKQYSNNILVGLQSDLPISGNGKTLFVSEDTNNMYLFSSDGTPIQIMTSSNLPLDIVITGGTYSDGILSVTNNTGGTFTVSGFSTGSTSSDVGGFIPLTGTIDGSAISGNLEFDNQSDKGISFENTDNLTAGKSLTISAGGTVEGGETLSSFTTFGQTSRNWYTLYTAPNGDVYATLFGAGLADMYKQTGGVGNFVALGETLRNWFGVAVAPNGDVYASEYNGDIYIQTGGVGAFTALGEPTRNWQTMTVLPNGNVYATTNGGDIYRREGGVGPFTALGEVSRDWRGIMSTSAGHIYCAVLGGDIYFKKNESDEFAALDEPSRSWQAMTQALNGDIYACVFGGDIYKQIGESFIAIGQASRNWRGMTTLANGDIYAVNAVDIYRASPQSTPNINGGALFIQGGRGNGTGTSIIEFQTSNPEATSDILQNYTTKLKIEGNGQIIIGVTPTTDNTVTNILGRNSDGSIVSVDKDSFSGTTSPLEIIDEGNGNGIVIAGRDVANYGNVGVGAVDLSISLSPSEVNGATGAYSFAEGANNVSSGIVSHAEGLGNISSGFASHAEGNNTQAIGGATHAEGSNSQAIGDSGHAEGYGTIASGDFSHAEGRDTIASGNSSHAEGNTTTASGQYSHAEGFGTTASGDDSHAGGTYTNALSKSETSIGSYNTPYTASSTTEWSATDRIFGVGNGIDNDNKNDALIILKNGIITAPSLTTGMITTGTSKTLVTKEYLESISSGGDYIPLTGTTTDNGITGDLNFGDNPTAYKISKKDTTNDKQVYIDFNPSDGISFIHSTLDLSEYSLVNINRDSVIIAQNKAGAKGITGSEDYSPNIGNLDYPQKIYVDSKSRPYKTYSALLSQTSTNNPIATVLENSLGGTVVWTRAFTGIYYATLVGAFDSGKTFIINGANYFPNMSTVGARGTDDFVEIDTYSSGVLADGMMIDFPVEIRVYN